MSQTILIVDDEATQLKLMSRVVERLGYRVLSAGDGAEAIQILGRDSGPGIDLVILDLSMPKVDGMEVLRTVKPKQPGLPVIVLTAHASVENVVEAMKAGANDFIAKPASAEHLRTAIASALSRNALVGELEPVEKILPKNLAFDDFIGSSPATREALDMALKAANSSIPVLIEGESGVGKELFARAIWSTSDRSGRPLVTVNCGAIPEKLVESILFGHEKGAFTGADERHIGKFEEADGGTLFLDEIGELPLDIQVKLLRALESGEIDRVGSRVPIPVDIRLISATNRDLATQVQIAEFREDLYYRLNVFPIRVPPLRRRRADIPELALHFLKRIAMSEKLPEKTIAPESLDLLMGHDWPGNIRQLQNAIFRAAILCEEDELKPTDFPQILAQSRRKIVDERATSRDQSAGNISQFPLPAGEDRADAVALISGDGHFRSLAYVEREAIRMALKRYRGHMSEVARRLGIGRSTLYRKIAEFGLDKDGGDDDGDSEHTISGRN